MIERAILVCHDPRASHWELGDLTSVDKPIHVLGWRGFLSIDAGPPGPIVDVICKWLVEDATVTFLTSEIDVHDPEVTGTVHQSGFLSRFTGRPLAVVTTRQPEKLHMAFDDAKASWSLKGQVLLGAAPGDSPPILDATSIADLFGNRWFDEIEGLRWIVRPGVDGDVLGVWTKSPQVSVALFAILFRQCSDAGIAWLELGEAQFIEQLAG